MKKIALLAALMMAAVTLSAQQTFKDWHNIDQITIHQPLHVADYSTLYLLPVDESEVEFSDKDKDKTARVFAQIAAFREILKAEIEKQIPGLQVVLVDQAPAELQSGEMVMSMALSQFDLGSRALRIWIGFGAGNASIQMRGHLTDSQGATILDFKQKRLSASMKDYPELVRKFENTLSGDVVTILTRAGE